MRSVRFVDNQLYVVIQLVAKESKANEKSAGISRLWSYFKKSAIYLRSFTLRATILTE